MRKPLTEAVVVGLAMLAVAPSARGDGRGGHAPTPRGPSEARLPRTEVGRADAYASTMQLATRLSERADPDFAMPPAPWLAQDPADSLYRAGRDALNRGDYERAALLFRRIRERFPRSDYTPDAYYWEAFALYRSGNPDRLRVALQVLDRQAGAHPDASTRSQADVLATRIQGQLAAHGDAGAAERVAERAAPLAPAPSVAPPVAVAAPSAAGRPVPAPAPRPQYSETEDDLRIAALNALLQMDEDRAVPILRQVLARRDPGSMELRRKAVFLVSQKRTSETEDILLDVARNDPDAKVRAQAVFWLSQVPTERAVTALDSILQGSTDREVQKKAIFALSQHRSERSARSLRMYVERRDAPEELRSDAIFWLGQQASNANGQFLRELYPRLQSEKLKERVIFSLSQRKSADNQRWLLELARNGNEPLEMRKKALFWAGQTGVSIGDLIGLYETMNRREMREQLIFVYSQRRETEAVNKLMDIARRESEPELRRKAIFWLGQSKDPRVAQFLLEIINQ